MTIEGKTKDSSSRKRFGEFIIYSRTDWLTLKENRQHTDISWRSEKIRRRVQTKQRKTRLKKALLRLLTEKTIFSELLEESLQWKIKGDRRGKQGSYRVSFPVFSSFFKFVLFSRFFPVFRGSGLFFSK